MGAPGKKQPVSAKRQRLWPPGIERAFSAVFTVGADGVAESGQLHPNLMRSAGKKVDIERRKTGFLVIG